MLKGKKRRAEDEAYHAAVVEDEPIGETDGIPGAASKNVENEEQAQEDEFGAKDYR